MAEPYSSKQFDIVFKINHSSVIEKCIESNIDIPKSTLSKVLLPTFDTSNLTPIARKHINGLLNGTIRRKPGPKKMHPDTEKIYYKPLKEFHVMCFELLQKRKKKYDIVRGIGHKNNFSKIGSLNEIAAALTVRMRLGNTITYRRLLNKFSELGLTR